MTNLAIFTANTPDKSKNDQAYDHFEKTIANLYDFASSTKLTTLEKANLTKLYPKGEARFWGSRPGKESEWKKLVPGDLFMISQNGYYIFTARLRYAFHNKDFAEEVWGKDSDSGEIWEYVYFLDDFQDVSLEARPINEKLKFYPGFGFKVIPAAEWQSALGVDFFSDKIKEYENETEAHLEQDAVEEIEKSKKTKAELLKEANTYRPTGPGYTTKLKERKERHDDEVQKAKLKKIEDYSCQICNFKLPYKNKKGVIRYSIEAAHILAKRNKGTEIAKNIIVLCYNCHKKLDLGVITIEVSQKEIKENGVKLMLHHDYDLFA